MLHRVNFYTSNDGVVSHSKLKIANLQDHNVSHHSTLSSQMYLYNTSHMTLMTDSICFKTNTIIGKDQPKIGTYKIGSNIRMNQSKATVKGR